MKSVKMFFVSVLAASCLFADVAIAVIDFDSQNHCTQQQASVITDLFRNELIRSGRADIADRKNMDSILAEIQLYMSDLANPAKAKRVGKMVGADYLITGKFSVLGDKLNLIVQMVEFETAKAVNSSRITLSSPEEFDQKVKDFADDFIQKLPAGNILTGTWASDFTHDDIIESYEITFGQKNRCNIKITSMVNGHEYGATKFRGLILTTAIKKY